ncbi:MAG: 30S ribosomal protein S2, partial [Nitrospirae bacterium]|nr:30S ribosomal protein S2 [Nitrospirota bacterium]
KFVRDKASTGESMLFVGTKKQAQDVISEEANRGGAFYVNNRWLGGMLTNFSTVKKSIERMKKIESMKEDGTFERLTKKETTQLEKERMKLEKNLVGIKDMAALPGVIIIIDPKKERIAVAEAKRLAIPVVALVDTNCDPDIADCVIPGNDDAIRAIKLISSKMVDAILEGRGIRTKSKAEDMEREQIEEKILQEEGVE